MNLLFSGLNKNSIWLDLLNEFLRTLSEHSRLIHGTNKIDFFTIESLSQMHKCCFKAILSKR